MCQSRIILTVKKEVKMRIKKLKLILILLFGFGIVSNAQTLYVEKTDGARVDYSLSDIGKISFSSGNLMITKTDKSSEVFELSNLSSLKFSDTSTGVEEPLAFRDKLWSIYPNPATSELNIDLPETFRQKGTISIFSIGGSVLMKREVTSERLVTVDISHLPKGIYLCRYSNSQETQTVKFIKQ